MEQGVTGSVTKEYSRLHIYAKMEWSEEYDRNNNYSELTVKISMGRMTQGTSEIYADVSIQVDENQETEYNLVRTISYQSDTMLMRRTFTVPHRPDGSKSVLLKGVSMGWINGRERDFWGALWLKPENDTITLTTITPPEPVIDPKASTMTVSNGELESPIYFAVTRQNTNYTHTITYEFGNEAGTIVNKSSNISVQWTPPASLANNFPAATVISGTYIITTFNGNTQIGNPNRYNAFIRVPDTAEFRPSFDLSNISVVNTGAASGWTDAIMGISKASISVSNTDGRHASSISSIVISADGSDPVSASSAQFDVLTAPKMTITATVTNQRGYSTVKAKELTGILTYGAPVITSASVNRCDEDETEAADGAFIKIVSAWSYSEVGDNTIDSAKAFYRATGEAQYTELDDITEGTVIIGGSLSENQSYDIKLVITDSLGNSDDYVSFISTKSVPFNIKIPGNGAAFGKYAEHNNLLDIAWDTDIHGDLTAGDTTVNGDLTVTGGFETDGDITANNLTLTGDADISGDLDVTGDIDVTGTVSGGGFSTTGALTAGSASISGNLTAHNLTGDVSVGEDLSVNGDLSASGDADIGGTLDATGKINANGGLGVTGNLTVSADSIVSGDQLINGGQIVNGSMTANNNETVYGNLTVSAKSGQSNTGNVSVHGSISAGDTITSIGKITSNGGMDVKGGNGLAVTGNETVSGTLTSTGKVFANGGLAVTGNETVSLKLTANNIETISSADIGGPLNVDGSITAKSAIFDAMVMYMNLIEIYEDLLISNHRDATKGNLEVEGNTTMHGSLGVGKGITTGSNYTSEFQGGIDVWNHADFANLSDAEKENALNSLGIYDWIVENGTSGIWTYQKWYSGRIKFWGETSAFTLNSSGQYDLKLPFDFSSAKFLVNGLQYSAETLRRNYSGYLRNVDGTSYCRIYSYDPEAHGFSAGTGCVTIFGFGVLS